VLRKCLVGVLEYEMLRRHRGAWNIDHIWYNSAPLPKEGNSQVYCGMTKIDTYPLRCISLKDLGTVNYLYYGATNTAGSELQVLQ
jgi:hypothetical protein